MGELLFDDFFKVEDVDTDGKTHDKVSRIVAKSEKRDMYLSLDVDTEAYPLNKNERFLMVLSPPVAGDGGLILWKFEYLMRGRVYTIEQGSNDGHKVVVRASFAGLQMMLRGHSSHFLRLEVDQKLFLLIRKIETNEVPEEGIMEYVGRLKIVPPRMLFESGGFLGGSSSSH